MEGKLVQFRYFILDPAQVSAFPYHVHEPVGRVDHAGMERNDIMTHDHLD
jgi:hypothetical protein